MIDKEAVLNRISNIPRLRLANRPTPIEPCRFLPSAFDSCPKLYIKRDDSIGYLVGGNKVRKLEYVMAEVLERGASAVVTVGSVQSNHARTTAMAARRLGLKCELVLNGEPPDPPCANFLINRMLGVPIHLIETREERLPRMEEAARRLEREGETVFRISLGASDSIGALGFVTAFEELMEQEKELGIRFDHILISSSSGGTQAGLEVGKRIFGRPRISVLGISPDDPAASIRNTVLEIGNGLLERLGQPPVIRDSEVEVNDDFIGEGYGISTPASEEALRFFNQLEGILLDPVYTAKAAAALFDFCRKGRFRPDEKVLFWHTGGLISLFR